MRRRKYSRPRWPRMRVRTTRPLDEPDDEREIEDAILIGTAESKP